MLKYIKNENKRFKTFVANRVTTIREASDVDQWRYISTAQNPADDASRGLKMEHLTQKRWSQSPEFLLKSVDEWPTQYFDADVADDPEITE